MGRNNQHQYHSFSFAGYPAIRLVLLFAAGIIIGVYFRGSLYLAITLFSVELLIYLFAHKAFRKNYNLIGHRLSVFLYLLIIVTTGFISVQLSGKKDESNLTEKTLQLSTKDTLSFQGHVVEAKNKGYYHQYVVHIDNFKTGLIHKQSADFKILVRAKWTLMRILPKPGDQMSFRGVMTPLPEVRNPHQFNYKQYLAKKDIHLECNLIELDWVTPVRNYFSWFWWRNQINAIIKRNFNSKNIPIAMALLLGNKSALSTQTKNNFNRAGISHLLAVSGLHVGFIIMPIWFLIPWFWYHKKWKSLAVILIVLLLFLYAGITGFRLSVIRASIMAFFFLSARLYQRRSNSINLMGMAALLILIFEPTALFDVSFQLSFGAVAVILLLYPVIQQSLPVNVRYNKLSFFITIVIISLIVQIGLFPILAWYFHQFSIIAPISNIFAIPMAEFIVLWSWICVGIGAISPSFGHIANWPANLLVTGLRALSQQLTMFKWSWVNVHISSPLIFLTWFSALMFFASWYNARIKWKWFIITIVSLIIFQIPVIYRKTQPPNLKITIFDVGEADAILLQTPHQKKILIDTGLWHPNGNSGQTVLVPELRGMGIRHLNALILTLPHADHIGGVIPLLKKVTIDTIYNSGLPHKSHIYRNYLRLAHSRHIPVKQLYQGYPLLIDPAVKVFVLEPERHLVTPDDFRHAVILKIVYGHTSFLMESDADKESEQNMIKEYASFLDSDFLKIAHHGSSKSSTSKFLKLVTPKTAVISASINNRSHFPDLAAIQRIIKSGANMHYTSLEHAIIFKSDGMKIKEVHWH